MYKVFISHSKENKELAQKFTYLLQDLYSLEDREILCSSVEGVEIKGSRINDEIWKAIGDSSCCFLALLTPQYFESEYCLMEIGAKLSTKSELIYLIKFHGVDITNHWIKDYPEIVVDCKKEDHSALTSLIDKLTNDLSNPGNFKTIRLTKTNNKIKDFIKFVDRQYGQPYKRTKENFKKIAENFISSVAKENNNSSAHTLKQIALIFREKDGHRRLDAKTIITILERQINKWVSHKQDRKSFYHTIGYTLITLANISVPYGDELCEEVQYSLHQLSEKLEDLDTKIDKEEDRLACQNIKRAITNSMTIIEDRKQAYHYYDA